MTDPTTRRSAWLASLPNIYCAVCRLAKRAEFALEVHHIASRNVNRPDLYEHPFNWLAVCASCHREYHSGKLDHATMALAKAKANPDEFDLQRLAELRPEKFGNLYPGRRARA